MSVNMSVISIYVSVICDMYVIKGLKSAVIIHFTERPKLQKKGSIACHPPAQWAPPPAAGHLHARLL